MVRRHGRPILGAVVVAVFCAGLATPAAWCSKKHGKAITADGRPIRKVYIDAGGPDMGNAAATQLTQDTCLTRVSSPKQADAVLDVGIALPSVGNGGGTSGPAFFGSAPQAETMGTGQSDQPKRSASATCSDSKGGGCTGSYTGGGAGPAAETAGIEGNSGGSFDVSLAAPGNNGQDLWDPKDNSKKSWSEQLRIAAGCPVCPHGHFDRRKYRTYRNWIQTECPNVLEAQ